MYLHIPRDVQELNRMKAEFSDVAQMPNIVGAIDNIVRTFAHNEHLKFFQCCRHVIGV